MLAKSLLEAGRADESKTLYRQIVEERPDTAEAHYGLGRIAAERGEASAAVAPLLRACELFPGFGAAHYALARAYRATGDEAKAREQLRPLPEGQAGVADGPGSLARRHRRAQDRGERPPQEGHPARGGRAAEGGGRGARGGARDRPKLVQAHVNLIRLYAQLGQPDKAEEHYRSALAVDPNLAELHHNYGVLLSGQGRSAEATKAFRKAVALNPAHAEAQSSLAYLLMTSGKLDEAALHYRAAIESRPQHRAAHFNLARILVQQGSLREAIEHLEQTLLPEDDETPRCMYALGAAWARAGNREEALRYMREARWRATTLGQTKLLARSTRTCACWSGGRAAVRVLRLAIPRSCFSRPCPLCWRRTAGSPGAPAPHLHGSGRVGRVRFRH